MNEVVSVIVGLIAPILFSLLKRVGLSGVPMLWVVFGVSIGAAVLVNLVSGTLTTGDVATSAGIIVATAQTIYHAFVKDSAPTA